jgi:DNA-binding NtrC family response regulator
MVMRCIVLSAASALQQAGTLAASVGNRLAVRVEVLAWPGPDRVAAESAQALVLLLDGLAADAALAWCRQHLPPRERCPLVVVVPGDRSEEIAGLMGAGAADFLLEPFSPCELIARIQRALGLVDPPQPAADPQVPPALSQRLIGSAPAFRRQVGRVAPMANCDAGVLILGETGTGKEVFAQAIHYTSARAGKPWVALNCGAVPHDLIEDELFGHVKGAYTTAHASRTGLVREAEGGTLFLDDIDCLPLTAQAKLLRFLQEREYRAVGANAVMRADVRVIAASNRDLSTLAVRGEFRQDLYFRLNILTLSLPPLRERREDIPALTLHFLRHHARQAKRAVMGLTPAAMRKLMTHDWPGNVRELQHVIERAVLLTQQTALDADDIDVAGVDKGAGLSGLFNAGSETLRSMKARVVENFERGYIEHLLCACHGNVTHAARAAGKNRRAFFALIRKYRIEPQQFRSMAG